MTAGQGSIPGPGLPCSCISSGKKSKLWEHQGSEETDFYIHLSLKQVWVFIKRTFLLVYEVCYQYTHKPQEEWLSKWEISEKTQLRRPARGRGGAQLSLIRGPFTPHFAHLWGWCSLAWVLVLQHPPVFISFHQLLSTLFPAAVNQIFFNNTLMPALSQTQ